MKYFRYKGHYYVDKDLLPALSSYGDFVGEFIGNSVAFHPTKAISCFSFVTVNGKPTWTEPAVCEGCKHYIPCAISEDGEERKYEEESSRPLVQGKPFDEVKFTQSNSLIMPPVGVKPEDVTWP